MNCRTFLDLIFHNRNPTEYIELRCLGENRPKRMKFLSVEPINQQLIEKIQAEKYNVFFGVACRNEDYSVSSLQALWVDIDFKDFSSDGIIPVATTIVAKLVLSAISPSIIVSSGHGIHAYWLLESPLTDVDLGKDVLKRLAKTFDGDSCHDPTRILRLPDSYNLKDKDNPILCSVVGGNGERYELAEIMANVTVVPSISDNIVSLIDSGSVTGFKSRSERDFAVIKELVLQGNSYQEVENIFQENKIGDKYREKGANGHLYLTTTYNAVSKGEKNK